MFLRIRKEARQLNGARVLVYLAIGKPESSWLFVCGSVGQDQLHFQAMKCVRARQAEILLLADGEVIPDRIDRRNTRYRAARGGDQIAYLDSCDAGNAIDERCEACEAKVHLGIFKRALRRDDPARAASTCALAVCTWAFDASTCAI